MKQLEDAAKYLRMVWQGHDELNEQLCTNGAYGLYSILTDADEPSKRKAAELVKSAFWISDEADKFRANENREDMMYQNAKQHLIKSRELVGLEIRSPQFTVAWWKAYRHKDKSVLLENLVKEHLCQIGNDHETAKQCADLLIEAANYHKERNWGAVEKKLEEYFEIYFKHVLFATVHNG